MVGTKVVKIAIQLVGSYDFAILLPLDVLQYGRNRNMVGAARIAAENRRYGGIVRLTDSGCLLEIPVCGSDPTHDPVSPKTRFVPLFFLGTSFFFAYSRNGSFH